MSSFARFGSEGDTLEPARLMATDAIQGYLESLRKHGEPIPIDESITEQLAVKLPNIPLSS